MKTLSTKAAMSIFGRADLSRRKVSMSRFTTLWFSIVIVSRKMHILMD